MSTIRENKCFIIKYSRSFTTPFPYFTVYTYFSDALHLFISRLLTQSWHLNWLIFVSTVIYFSQKVRSLRFLYCTAPTYSPVTLVYKESIRKKAPALFGKQLNMLENWFSKNTSQCSIVIFYPDPLTRAYVIPFYILRSCFPVRT